MMSRLSRYILRQLAIGTIITTAVLACLVWMIQLLNFMELIINRGLSLRIWLELTLLLLPNFLVVVLPIALFLVVLFIYNKMYVDHELVVAQAAGVSRWAIAAPAFFVAALCTVISFMLTLYYGPLSMRAFKELHWSVRQDISQVLLHAGRFNHIGKGLTFYVRERDANGYLRGILVHDKRDEDMPVTVLAERGKIFPGPDTLRVLLFNGTRQELARGGSDLSLMYFDQYAFDMGSVGAAGDGRFTHNGERSTTELFTLTETDGLKPSTVQRMRVEGHQRLINPVLNLALTALALSFLLTGTFDRHGQIKRINLAAVSIVFIEVAVLLAASLAAKNLFFVPLIYAVVVLPLALGLCSLSDKVVAATLPYLLRRPPRTS